MRIVRGVEYDHRGSGGAWNRRRGRPARSGGPAVSARRPVGRFQLRAASHDRRRRARPGRGRRVRARFGDADRRRAGHRQIDPADPGLRRGCAIGRARRLCLGRGIDRPGSSARGPARTGRRARPARGADLRRGYRGDARLGGRAEVRGHRFDSDHVERRDRIGARNGLPGARLGAGFDPLRQGERRGLAAGRTCDQGRPDRRASRRRAHGRRGLFLRGRRRALVPSPEGGQEQVRRDRRGRRVRDDRRGLSRSSEPFGFVPRGPRRRRPSRRRGLRRRRRGAAASGRDPGPGCADDARHAAPRRRRLGAEPIGDGARGARGPWRA